MKVRTLEALPAGYATTQNNLGAALDDQAGLLAGPERAKRLEEAVGAYREALKVRTLDASPADYAMTQNNLGNALGNQAGLLAGPERATRLEEAVGREALKVWTLDASPADYAMTQNNLGTALGNQARLLADNTERPKRREEAERALREALAVYTEESFPHQHRQVRANLRQVEELATAK